MALDFQISNIPVDGVDNTAPATNQGTRNVENMRFTRMDEAAPGYPFLGGIQRAKNVERIFFSNGQIYYANRDRVWSGMQADTIFSGTTTLDCCKHLLAEHRTIDGPPVNLGTRAAFGAARDNTNRLTFFCWGDGANITYIGMMPDGARRISSQIQTSSGPTSSLSAIATTDKSSKDNLRCIVFPPSKSVYAIVIESASLKIYQAFYTTFSASGEKQFDHLSSIINALGSQATIAIGHASGLSEQTFDACNVSDTVGVVAYTTSSGISISSFNSSFGTLATQAFTSTLPATNTRICVYTNAASGLTYLFWTERGTNTQIKGVVLSVNGTSGAISIITAATVIAACGAATDFIASMACCPGYFDKTVTGLAMTVCDGEGQTPALPGLRHVRYRELFTQLLASSNLTNFARVAENITISSKCFESKKSDSDSKSYFYANDVEWFTGGAFFCERIVTLDVLTPDTIDANKKAITPSAGGTIGRPRMLSVATLGIGRTLSGGVSQVAYSDDYAYRMSVLFSPVTELQNAQAITPAFNFSSPNAPVIRETRLGGFGAGVKVDHAGDSYWCAGSLYKIYPNSSLYDGFYDTGFALAPNVVGTFGATGTIPALTSITFKFLFYAEAQGRKDIIGPPSEAYVFTAPGSGTTKLTLSIYSVISHRMPASQRALSCIVFIKDAGSGNYYFDQEVILSTSASIISGFSTIQYTSTPVANTANAQLYTDFQELPNVIPGGVRCAQSAIDRMVVVDDFGKMCVSKSNNATRGIEFSDLLIAPTPPDNANVEALGSMDNALVLFGDKNIYAMSGGAPDSFGNGSFTPWSKVQTDISCNSQQSVLATTDGIFFGSKRGIMILDRGYSAQPVGAKIFDFNTGGSGVHPQPVVSSAAFYAANSEALFAFIPNPLEPDSVRSSVNYPVAIYNTKFGKWTYLRKVQVGGSITAVAADNYIAYNLISYPDGSVASPSYGVWFSTSSASYDSSLFNPSLYDTGWLPFFGGQQYGRVREISILLRVNEPGDITNNSGIMTVTYYVDYDDSTAKVESFALNSVLAGSKLAGTTSFALKVSPNVQQVRALRVVVSFRARALSIRGFSFELSPKNGTQKINVAQTA